MLLFSLCGLCEGPVVETRGLEPRGALRPYPPDLRLPGVPL